jgi:hypothetical protein
LPRRERGKLRRSGKKPSSSFTHSNENVGQIVQGVEKVARELVSAEKAKKMLLATRTSQCSTGSTERSSERGTRKGRQADGEAEQCAKG